MVYLLYYSTSLGPGFAPQTPFRPVSDPSWGKLDIERKWTQKIVEKQGWETKTFNPHGARNNEWLRDERGSLETKRTNAWHCRKEDVTSETWWMPSSGTRSPRVTLTCSPRLTPSWDTLCNLERRGGVKSRNWEEGKTCKTIALRGAGLGPTGKDETIFEEIGNVH